MTKLFAQLLSVVAVAVVTAGHAFATPVLDQSNTAINAGFCASSCNWQQTITAGMTGKLTGVALYGNGTATVRIGQAAGFNAGNWAGTVVGATVNQNNIIDLSSFNIFVTAGQSFVVDYLNGSGGLSGTFGTPHGMLYLNGSSFGTDWALGYRTYVDTDAASAVPEPASLGLFGLGLLGFAMSRRRKQ
jgi:hypothetical protein